MRILQLYFVCTNQVDWNVGIYLLSAFTVCLKCGIFIVHSQVTLLLFSDILLLLKKSGRSLLTLESPLNLESLVVSEENCEGMFLFFLTHMCIHPLLFYLFIVIK